MEALGLSAAGLKWAVRQKRFRKIERGVYAEGGEPLTALDRARGAVLACGGVASGRLAGVLLGLDAVELRGLDVTVHPRGNGHRAGVRRRVLAPDRVIEVDGVSCTDGLQTLVDLAGELDDDTWECALESALRKRLVTTRDLSAVTNCPGAARIRRVLAVRGLDVPATESLLETLMVQLARTVPGLPPPTRQYVVYDRYGTFVARVDLAWPELGIFIELDGQHHKAQPVYDARRETAVTAAKGWLCGRFTWHEVVYVPVTTARRLADIADQAQRRPLV